MMSISRVTELLSLAGLRISYAVANFIFAVLITILTEIWQLKLLQAFSITNFQDGAKGIIAVFIAFVSDAYLGDSITLLCSAVVYCGGLVMMYFAYPTITDEEIKACREKNICEEKPLGILFFLALLLVTVGQCGHKNYLEFVKWEMNKEKKEKYDQRKLTRQEGFTKRIIRRIHVRNGVKGTWLWWKRTWPDVSGFLIAIFVLPYLVSSKRNQLLIRACMLGFSSFLFVAGRLCLFPFQGARGSPIFMVFHIIFVAFKKRHYIITPETIEYLGDEIGGDGHESEYSQTTGDYGLETVDIGAYYADGPEPNDDSKEIREENKIASQYVVKHYHSATENEIDDDSEARGNDQSSERTSNLTDQLSWLNKVALYNPLNEIPHDEVENGRLCTVKEVEDAKCFVRAALLSLTFLMYGLIQAVSKTFFVEQADNMDRHYWKIKIPIQIIQGISTRVENMVINRCRIEKKTKPVEKMVIKYCQKGKHTKPVENMVTKPRRRFHGAIRVSLGMLVSPICFVAAFLVEEKRLKALKRGKILKVVWLIPQLILMGVMNGLAKSGIADFFDNEMPKSVSISYGTILADGLNGAGKLLSTALVVAINNVTKQHGHPSWFQYRINDSRIDKFYAVMFGFGFISWIIFAIVALLARHHKSTTSSWD